MHHESDIVLVNAHAECRRRDNDVVPHAVLDPTSKIIVPYGVAQASVEGPGADAVAGQPQSEGFAVAAVEGVDYAADIRYTLAGC